MKKIMILAASAALALVACTKNDVYQNTTDANAVTFGVYAGNSATKATYGDITTDNLKTSTDGFGVFAYYTMNNAWSASDTPNFMYNQQVKYNPSANTTLYPSKWEYTPLKYWPNGQNSTTVESGTITDKLSFYAYAPQIATANLNSVPATGQGITAMSANNAAGAPTLNFTVPAKAQEQIDLLWAIPVLNQTKQTITGTVNFTFKHALAKLNPKVQAVVDAVNPTTTKLTNDWDNVVETGETFIVLESLEIKADGTKSGTLTLDSATDHKPNWSAKTGESVILYNNDSFKAAKKITVSDKTGFYVKEAVQDIDTDYSPMIIPGEIASGKYVITANYWVLTEDSALNGGFSKVQQVIKKTSDTAIEFKAGYKYDVLIKLGLTNVSFDVTEVTVWGTDPADPNSNVDLPQNNNA